MQSLNWISFAETIFPLWVSCVLFYLPLISFLQQLDITIPVKKINFVSFIWNSSLSCLSFCGLFVALYDLYINNQLGCITTLNFDFDSFPDQFKSVIAVFSLTKVFEFGDTIILVLKRRKPSFLHIFHHFTVAIYCYFAFLYPSPVDYVFCLMNLFVHSIMYFYFAYNTYLKNARFLRPFITFLQILQMIIGTTCSVLNLYLNDTNLINLSCFFMYFSYLFLFVKFALEQYIM
jgi:hypothetical protein